MTADADLPHAADVRPLGLVIAQPHTVLVPVPAIPTVPAVPAAPNRGVNLGGVHVGGSDNHATPRDRWAAWDEEFAFTTDAAADATNHLCLRWYGPGSPFAHDALAIEWGPTPPVHIPDFVPEVVWLNPPFSRVADFAAKAYTEAAEGRATTVMLCKVVSDTRWWHRYVWDVTARGGRGDTYPGVELRLLKGRLKFVGQKDPAPFPCCLVVFRAGEILKPRED